MIRLLGLEDRKCSQCKTNTTYFYFKNGIKKYRWYKDKWKNIGWLCSYCYNQKWYCDKKNNNIPS